MNKMGRGNNFWNSQDVLQGWYFDGFGFAACLLEIKLGNASATRLNNLKLPVLPT